MEKDPRKQDPGMAIGIGVCFFVVFWLALDSVALGIGIGVALAAAFATSTRKNCVDESASESEGKSENS